MGYINRIEEQEQVFYDGKKLKIFEKMLIFEVIKKYRTISSNKLIKELNQEGTKITVSQRHINRLRVIWGFSRRRGRPSGESKLANLVELKSNISHVGVHIFDSWVEGRDEFSGIIINLEKCIKEYKGEHFGENFRILHNKRETLELQFKALLYAPFFDIGKLSEYDHKENPLKSVIGRSYQSSTLNQFLGQMERIDASKAIKKVLIPEVAGEIAYVDGVMSPYWTRVSMHKGLITMLGRIMAGSQTIISHNENGHAVYFLHYPPDKNLSPIILEYCLEVNLETRINLFVVDRGVNSEENARKFQEKGLGLLCMLDSNEYNGISDFETKGLGKLADESIVYEGIWKNEKKRLKDSRTFVLVEEKERILVYWGNEKFKELLHPLKWPETYRERTEIQENSFKRMTAHGKLKVNFGTKKIMGPDRHQERKREEIQKKLTSTEKKLKRKEESIEKQIQKVKTSEEKGHQNLLLKRKHIFNKLENEQKKLDKGKDELEKKLDTLEPDKQRADRDFRKQSIMTFRTLLLENLLLSFFSLLLPTLSQKINLDLFIEIFFKRSGSFAENPTSITYWINTEGLSTPYKKTLSDITEEITKMNIKCRGKPIQLRLKGIPIIPLTSIEVKNIQY